ncbi:MAG: DUF4112 domain-containing protein, partial [Beijerinckiaceae bacterium]
MDRTTALPFPSGHSAEAVARLDQLAVWLDDAFRLPGTNIRFGADAVMALVPGAGPLVGKALASYLLMEAYRLGVPRPVLMRMLKNSTVDLAISSIPLVGWVGDVLFKANRRNMQILRAHLAAPAV